MGLHPYCITPAGHAPGDATGLGGMPVVAVTAAGLAAWASEHAEPVPASVDAVRAHDAVIRSAMTPHVTPVPLRFGQWAASPAVLRERLVEHAARWSALLQEFAGAVEMGLRFDPLGPAATPAPGARARAASGRAYMEQLAARVHDRDAVERERTRLLERVEAALGDVALRSVSGASAEDARALWVAHLVRLGRAAEYRRLANRTGQEEAGYRMAVTGPWPPYSFAS